MVDISFQTEEDIARLRKEGPEFFPVLVGEYLRIATREITKIKQTPKGCAASVKTVVLNEGDRRFRVFCEEYPNLAATIIAQNLMVGSKGITGEEAMLRARGRLVEIVG